MQGPAHLVISWFVGEASGLRRPRDRRLVALAGIAPDVDSVGYAAAYLAYGFDLDRAFEIWQLIHHRYTHGLGFLLLTGIAAWCLAHGDTRLKVTMLVMAVSALHVGADLVAAGPEWPLYPFWPLSDSAWSVEWSIRVSDWRNGAITFACLAAVLIWSRMKGYSPLESINYAADQWMARVASGQGGSRGSVRLRVAIYVVLAVVVAAVVIPLIRGL